MLGARRREWATGSAQAELEVGTTQRVLTTALRDYYERERAVLMDGAESSRGGESLRSLELQREAELVERGAQAALGALQRERGPGKVPDFFCCKITMEVMLDPVITPDGVTYERAALTEHLHKVGAFDPLTRRPLEPRQLVPNLALKEAISAYLERHPWAFEEDCAMDCAGG